MAAGQGEGRCSDPISAECRSLQSAMAVLPPQATSFLLSALQNQPEGFDELNELVSRPPPACSSCKNCSTCRHRLQGMSEENRETLERVETEMTLSKGQLTGSYPWKPCAERMRSNREQVLKVQKRIEARAMKDGTHEQLVKEMEKAIEEGSVRRLSQQEIALYEGPVNYNPYFGVKNEKSSSTKLRVVLHSAHVNTRSGLSLNDCMDKGPNQITSLVECLIHWRTVEKAMMADLKKAYQAIKTGEKELHLRRIVYRRAKGAEWEDYGYTRATFGDLAAGLLLEAAKRRAAAEGEHLDPLVAKQLRENVYVDDICGGGSPEEVERMVGDEATGGGTLHQILETCE